MRRYDLVICGLGGQGVMTISHVLAAAAAREGLKVKLFEGTGISQRGGGVFAFVRFGGNQSPKIPSGRADAIVSLEMSEIARVIGYLKPEGEVWASSGRIDGYYTRLHPELYPSQESIVSMVGLRTSRLRIISADRLAEESGSPRAANMVMLGAFARGSTVLEKDSIIRAIEETNRRFAPSNLKAFREGYGSAGGEGVGVSNNSRKGIV
ncbi:MAG: 2-oxoacid:acceptor oxidoreductase family protein [Deltaproteobacteria bacterium]|nr:2-oxoacid:acceptor oxidoreductase family protein [Deltaproteobacteria bacterium]